MRLVRIVVASCLTFLGVSLAVLTVFMPASSSTAAVHRHGARPVLDAPLPRAGLGRILAAVGCVRPKVQVDAAELHQVACSTTTGRYTIMTFTERANQDAWLGEAQAYGGTYLVGDRWTVVASSALLPALRTRLGGRIEDHQQ
ncbi:MAG: hypothetical protein HOV96_26415 [Nonomuraea sp.]|nr:hypothetical protein [Streptomyces sp.]NUP81083.1 hypothetical protein [Nonomuraea sp.]